MNYIGSKLSLLPAIERVLDSNAIPNSGIALDLFAGTGIVAQFLKKRGYITYANDWQYYSYITCTAFLKHNELPSFDGLLSDNHWGSMITNCTVSGRNLPVCSIASVYPAVYSSEAAQVLSYLSNLSGKPGAFYHNYCEGGSEGRQYYSSANGLKIQAVRDQIEAWAGDKLVSPEEHACLSHRCLRERIMSQIQHPSTALISSTSKSQLKIRCDFISRFLLTQRMIPIATGHSARIPSAYYKNWKTLAYS